ncbi:hypothetical protein [Mycolicibacterium sp.]|uniref:hypothetical protein n=1 Tax=Mycolicibacterium sp. TaxID=2320850 RepID=UPI00355E4141
MMVPRGDGNECARRAPEPTGALRRTVRQNLLNQPGRVWVGFGPQIAGPRDCGADYPRDWRVQAVPG